MTDIAKEYGTALFEVACEVNEKKRYAEALETVKRTALGIPQLLELISSPGIPLNERLDVIDRAFSEALPEHVLSYLKLMCEKGRIGCLIESIEEFRRLFDESERVSVVKVTSAIALTDEEKQRLTDKLTKKENRRVTAEYFVDPTLLGGLSIEVDGKIMDGSVRRRLRDVKEVINK